MSTAGPALGGSTPKSSLVSTDIVGRLRHATDEPVLIKILLIGTSLVFLSLVLFVPLVAIFAEALRKGLGVYFASFTNSAALSAIWLTLLTAGICVPLNVVFGLAAAWAGEAIAGDLPTRKSKGRRGFADLPGRWR